jgi:acyl-[acyl-carrier-protein]-phospholipid O-acyltransferase/long-chain-fatty-acid--[acyl-carrier-protein] ligase
VVTERESAPPSGFAQLCRDSGFQSFLWTQFLGAFNDNVYKIIVSMRAVHIAATTGSGSEYLALAGAIFVLPFLLFSGYSGHLADAVSKRSVLVAVKVFEIAVMVFGLAAFFSTRIELMLVVLFLMAVHSTIFSPAKYGIVPEMLPAPELSRANAFLEMSTFVAIVLGTAIGSFLFTLWKQEPWKMGLVTIAIAVAGLLTSLRIPRVPPSGARQKFAWNPFAEVITGTRSLVRNHPLWLTVMAISYFWFLGALFQLDLLLFGSEVLKVSDLKVGLLITSLAIGIGAGSMLAGRLSGNKVEPGLVPIGSFLMAVFSVALYFTSSSYAMSVVVLACLGIASGLFVVPLNAFLQQHSGAKEKGRILGVNNFYNTVGMLLASGTLWLFHDRLHIAPDKLILVFGLLTLVATAYIVKTIPEFFLRFLIWLLTHTLFRIRIVGRENIPQRGAALLIVNHVSFADGFVLSACVQRFIRFLLWRPYYENPRFHWFFKMAHAVPMSDGGRRDTVLSLRLARKELEEGHVVCIFAEGAMSRTGNLLPFKRGFERIAKGLDVPVIPVHLDGLWGSTFSFFGGTFFRKKWHPLRYPLTVSFGAPLHKDAGTWQARNAMEILASNAAKLRKARRDLLSERFIRTARRNWAQLAMADSAGRELTYGQALKESLLIADFVKHQSAREEYIAVLLPASAGGALANIGITIAGCVPVNLNFTAGEQGMQSAVEQCGIRHVVTTRAFLEKAGITAPATPSFLDDLLASRSAAQKLKVAMQARFWPADMFRYRRTPDSLATVLFSSGSSGQRKCVMLSHFNILSNIDAMTQVYSLTAVDRITGILPFFHAFGLTVTLWLPVVKGCAAVYHPNPTDARAVGALIAKYRTTFLISTPTFCSHYIRRCAKEDFASLRFALSGAEKVHAATAAAFEEKFALPLLEGYGCTEMSPVVAVNVPDHRGDHELQTGTKRGTVGHPLPGVAARIVHPDSKTPLPPGEEGLLLVNGPNQMLGYLGQPQRRQESRVGDWYCTGDMASIDDDGFLRITGRVSRFSKIAGEMAPHVRVEEAAQALLGDAQCAVTGVEDGARGERLVMFHTSPSLAPADLYRQLSETELPQLWIPKRDDIHFVAALPELGSGKPDLSAIRALAEEYEHRKLITTGSQL